MAIDIGNAAIDRAGQYQWAGDTIINGGNPANASGTITSVEIWAAVNLEGCVIGTFYKTNGDTLKCRASAAIGNVTAGSKQTFSGLSVAVQTGDFIGIYFTAGSIERDTTGFINIWWVTGQYIDPNDEATYAYLGEDAISVYGIGTEAAVAGRSQGYIIG